MDNFPSFSTTYSDSDGTVHACTVKGNPPYFSMGNNAPDALSHFTMMPQLTIKARDLITAIFDLCLMEKTKTVSIDLLRFRLLETSTTGKSISASGIRKRIKPLVDAGLFTPITIPPPNGKQGRAAILYQLTDASEPLNLQPNQSTLSLTQLALFDESQSLNEFLDPNLRMDNFWCQLITSILPIVDRSQVTHVESHIYYQNEEIPLTATSRPGSRIPTIRSIKTVIALLTLVELIIKENVAADKPSGQRFTIEIGQLLKLMKLANEGGNRRTVIQHLQEWENTLFKFHQIPQKIRASLNDRFGVETFGFSHHQLLSQLCGIGVLQNGQKTPAKIGFELPQDLVNRIRDQGVYNLFTVTPAIMSENNPLAIAFHLYCRKNIGHRSYNLTVSLRTLWKRIAPAMKFNDFSRSFSKMIETKGQRQQDAGYRKMMKELVDSGTRIYEHQANILGYNTTCIGERISVRVDLEDPFVGNASSHRHMKQQQARQQSSIEETRYRAENPSAYLDSALNSRGQSGKNRRRTSPVFFPKNKKN